MKQQEFYTAKELAEKLRVILWPFTLYRSEKTESHKIGKDFRIDKKEFDSFLTKTQTMENNTNQK